VALIFFVLGLCLLPIRVFLGFTPAARRRSVLLLCAPRRAEFVALGLCVLDLFRKRAASRRESCHSH
jgi:hypothetical protein